MVGESTLKSLQQNLQNVNICQIWNVKVWNLVAVCFFCPTIKNLHSDRESAVQETSSRLLSATIPKRNLCSLGVLHLRLYLECKVFHIYTTNYNNRHLGIGFLLAGVESSQSFSIHQNQTMQGCGCCSTIYILYPIKCTISLISQCNISKVVHNTM